MRRTSSRFSVCWANWQKFLNTIILGAGPGSGTWAVKPTAGQGCKLGWRFPGPFGNLVPKPWKDHFCVAVLANPSVCAQQETCPQLTPWGAKSWFTYHIIKFLCLWITDVRIHHLPITKYWWRITIRGHMMDLVAFLSSPVGRDDTEMLARGSWELGPAHAVWLQSLSLKTWEP